MLVAAVWLTTKIPAAEPIDPPPELPAFSKMPAQPLVTTFAPVLLTLLRKESKLVTVPDAPMACGCSQTTVARGVTARAVL